MAATLRASEYCERSSTDALFKSQALKATFFFARIASLTSWFHQGVFFSLLFVSPTRLRPQQVVADVLKSCSSFSTKTF